MSNQLSGLSDLMAMGGGNRILSEDEKRKLPLIENALAGDYKALEFFGIYKPTTTGEYERIFGRLFAGAFNTED